MKSIKIAIEYNKYYNTTECNITTPSILYSNTTVIDFIPLLHPWYYEIFLITKLGNKYRTNDDQVSLSTFPIHSHSSLFLCLLKFVTHLLPYLLTASTVLLNDFFVNVKHYIWNLAARSSSLKFLYFF